MLALRANNIRLTIVTSLYGAPIGRNTNKKRYNRLATEARCAIPRSATQSRCARCSLS
jgi:hypothetical protein